MFKNKFKLDQSGSVELTWQAVVGFFLVVGAGGVLADIQTNSISRISDSSNLFSEGSVLDYEAPEAINPEQEEIGGGIGGEPGPGSSGGPESANPGAGVTPVGEVPLGGGGGGGSGKNCPGDTDESIGIVGVGNGGIGDGGLQQSPMSVNCEIGPDL